MQKHSTLRSDCVPTLYYVIESNYWMQRTEFPEHFHIECSMFASHAVYGIHQSVNSPNSHAVWPSIECAWYSYGCWMQTKMDPTVETLHATKNNQLHWFFACNGHGCNGTEASYRRPFRTSYLLCWLSVCHVFDYFECDRECFQLCIPRTLSPASMQYFALVLTSFFWYFFGVLVVWCKQSVNTIRLIVDICKKGKKNIQKH